MRRNGLVAMAAAVTALASAAPAHAQSWKADIGVNGGGSFYTSMLSSDAWGGSGDAVQLKPGWLLGAQAGYWFTPRIGIRANGTYTDAKLKDEIYDDVNLWSLSGDLLYRFRTPAPAMTKMEFLPYLALGAGAKFIAPAGGAQWTGNGSDGIPFACPSSGNCVGPGTTLFGGTATGFFLEKATRLMGLVGLGGDLRLAPNFGLRVEVGDRLWKPMIDNVGTVTPPLPPQTFTATTTGVGKLVNEFYGQLGLQLLLGVAKPPVVAVTPTPAPPPPTPPPPPPPPAPATQNVSVCVVTPTAPTGLTSETAVYNPATGDTTIVVNGTPTPLRSAFTGVTTASGATWYVQGQPLAIGTGRTALAYVSFGTPRSIDMGDLTYIGTVNGLPVFANKTDVATLTIPAPPAEIGTNTALLTGLRKVQVLYVPLTSYGCNFQPIQLQQQVRKVRG